MVPENELGVVVLFAQQASGGGFEIISVSSQFPDAIVRKGDTTYRAEFEFQASNFKDHKHDVRECDLIIAWENNWPDSILPILALSEPHWAETNLALPSKAEREAIYWKQRALLAEARLQQERKQQRTQEVDPESTNNIGLPSGTMGKVFKLYALDPTATQAEIGKMLGISRQAVGQNLAKLEQEGLISRDGDGVKVLE